MVSFTPSFIALVALALFGNVQALAPPSHLARAAADLQTSLQLDPSQVQSNLKSTGQAGTPEAGQVPSATSVNNFINFCATQQTTLTNGLQTKAGSCNPTIMGRILAFDKLVASKFQFPANGQTIKSGETFTIKMGVRNLVTGNFVNPQTNYYAAPCQVDATGTVIGHSHVVVESVPSLGSTAITDPTTFVFFKGLNGVAANGVLSADVTGGLKAGTYRLASINACANHQPVLASVAQHGSMDDMVYFTVSDNGAAPPPATGAAPPASSASAAPPAASSASSASAAPPAASSAVAAPAKGSEANPGVPAAVGTIENPGVPDAKPEGNGRKGGNRNGGKGQKNGQGKGQKGGQGKNRQN